jgi:hypothetical protein
MARLILRMVETGEKPSEEELVMVREIIKEAGEEEGKKGKRAEEEVIIYINLVYNNVLYVSENQCVLYVNKC